MSLRDDINIPVVVVLGLATGLIVAVAIVGTRAGYNYVTNVDLARNYDAQEKSGNLTFGANTLRAQKQKLAEAGPKWANVEKTLVTIPIEDAKTLMVQSKGKPALK
jgi:hypothetical protein